MLDIIIVRFIQLSPELVVPRAAPATCVSADRLQEDLGYKEESCSHHNSSPQRAAGVLSYGSSFARWIPIIQANVTHSLCVGHPAGKLMAWVIVNSY